MSKKIGFVAPLSGGIGVAPTFSSLGKVLRKEIIQLNHAIDQPCEAYVLCMNGTIRDVREVKAQSSALRSIGVAKSQIFGVLFLDGSPGSLTQDLVGRELSVEIFKLHMDREDLFYFENADREIPPKSKFMADLGHLARSIKTSLEAIAAANEPTPPNIKDWEKELCGKVWDALLKSNLKASDVAGSVHGLVQQEIQAAVLAAPAYGSNSKIIEEIQSRLLKQLLGWGPLQDYIDDPSISEIMVNGVSDLYVERDGRIEKTDRTFLGESQLRIIIERMAAGMGRRVDTSSPLCDVRLPNGSRVNIVLPPLALNGPLITIRRFRPVFSSVADLIQQRALTQTQADCLAVAVREKQNILIAGGSSSGKTTLLNVLSRFIEPHERIVTLEDAAELDLKNPHVVRLETRKKNLEGVGEITMSDLVVNALRMRPDRIIVGECRGVEAVPMLQAMNTGHDGSMTTIHANSAKEAVHRLESMILEGAPHWPASVVRQQIASAIDLIVYLKRDAGVRKCEEINRLGIEGQELILKPVLEKTE